MARPRPLVLILAGGAGGRLDLLTRDRAKPAVPFGGTHRLIDFPLSNAHNANLSDVWVAQQFNPISLSDHLANGRPWDLDRTDGGLLILQPRLGHDERTGFHQGTADSLWRSAPMIREFAPDALVVVSADAVYRLDYAAVIDEHHAAGADLTMVTTEVEPGDAGRYGVVQVAGGKVEDYAYKPDDPQGNLIANEVFVFTPGVVLERLEALADAAGEDGLEDLGHELLPALVRDGAVREHRLDGYWRDVGTIPAYLAAHLELVADAPPFALDDPAWPILTRGSARRAPARLLRGAEVEGSLLAPASVVGGRVHGSVVSRGAVIEPGAVVRDAVVLPGAVVQAGARVQRAIVDDGVVIGDGAVVGEEDGEPALVGLRAQVPPGTRVPAGGRYPADEG